MYLSTSTHHSNQGYYSGAKKSIFLAGPTARNAYSGTKWRWDARQYLNDRDEIVLFVPEPTDLSDGYCDDLTKWWPKFEDQVDWELHHLQIADVIMFWIPREFPDYPGLTTNVEFGAWYRDSKTVYGRPNWSVKNEYLDRIWSIDRSTPVISDLEILCECALQILGQ